MPTRGWSDTGFALYSLVLGLGSYLVFAFATAVIHWEWPPKIWFLRALVSHGSFDLDYQEILSVSLVALVLGLGASLGLDRHWLQRFAQSTGISRKFGDLDVWAHTFNSPDYTNRWVVVRDFTNNLAFEGWVNAFSDTVTDHELLLRDVVVYESSTSTRLYEVDSVYLSRKKSELTIEFRKEETTGTRQGDPDATKKKNHFWI